MTRPSALFYAIIGTTIYVFFLIFLHGELAELPGVIASRISLNLLGDSLGGLTAPLALIWLIAAVITQRQELNLTKEELAKTAKAMNDQVAIAWASANANWQLSLFDKRIAVYDDLMDIGRDMGANITIDNDFMIRLGRISRDVKFVFGDDVQAWVKDLQDNIDLALMQNSEVQHFMHLKNQRSMVGGDEESLMHATAALKITRSRIGDELKRAAIDERFKKYLNLPEMIDSADYINTKTTVSAALHS